MRLSLVSCNYGSVKNIMAELFMKFCGLCFKPDEKLYYYYAFV